MTEYEFKNICQLILTDKTNAALALQMMKKRPELKKQVEAHFQPLLDILGKKSLRSIPTLIQKIAANKYKSKDLVRWLEWKEVHSILKDLSSIVIQLIDIKNVSENIGTLTQLKELFIHTTLIEQIPESIGQLTNLTELSLRNNQLKELPDSIGNLHQLETLRLYDNKLKELPDSIGNLSALKMLIVSNNELEVLPDSICHLSNLESLYLDNTKISALPKNINLPNLTEIYVQHCPLAKDIDAIKKACPNIKRISI